MWHLSLFPPLPTESGNVNTFKPGWGETAGNSNAFRSNPPPIFPHIKYYYCSWVKWRTILTLITWISSGTEFKAHCATPVRSTDWERNTSQETVAEARLSQAGNETYIFNQKLSGNIDSISYSLPKKLRPLQEMLLFIQMPIIRLNTGIMSENLCIQAYQIWWTIWASGLKISEWEPYCVDNGQQGEIIIPILQMMKKG